MCSLIGFGHWSRYYIYILIAFLARILKNDIFGVRVDVQIIADLRIIFHPIMILLIGFASDFILSMVIWCIYNYREKKKEENKNRITLLENEQQISKKSTPDKIFELKDSSNISVPINANEDDERGKSSSFNRESTLKYYLIHNELSREDDLVSKSAGKFIIISSGLIAIKEFMSNVFYYSNDMYSFYFINLITIAIILKCFYKEKIYKHHILSICIVIGITFICSICLILIANNTQGGNNNNFSIDYEKNLHFLFMFPIIYIVISIFFCTGLIFQKNLMQSKFIPSYKFLFYKGIIGICFCIIALIFTTNFPCPDLPYSFPDQKNNKTDNTTNTTNNTNITIPFLPIKCRDRYEEKPYFDNFYSYFINDDSKLPKNITAEIFILLGYFILNFVSNLSIILINKFLSPFHVLITECFYFLIHIPYESFIYLIPKKENNEQSYSEEDQIRRMIVNSYESYFKNWRLILVQVISVVFEILGYLIYMEIIQLNFCGFDKDISKNIKKRAKLDPIISIKELNDDNEDIMNNSFEMNDNQKDI